MKYSEQRVLFQELGSTQGAVVIEETEIQSLTWLHLVLHLGFRSVNPQTMVWIIQKLLGLSTAKAPNHGKSSCFIFSLGKTKYSMS